MKVCITKIKSNNGSQSLTQNKGEIHSKSILYGSFCS